MVEPSRPPQPEEALFTAVREEAEPKPWAAIIIVLVLLAVLLGLFVLLARGPRRTAAGANPYATQISFSDAKTTQVQNFLGANVTYIEGAVSNNGNKTVTGSEVQITFKNSLGEVVQQEEQPLKILGRSGPYPEAVDLRLSPLGPHQAREFRLTCRPSRSISRLSRKSRNHRIFPTPYKPRHQHLLGPTVMGKSQASNGTLVR